MKRVLWSLVTLIAILVLFPLAGCNSASDPGSSEQAGQKREGTVEHELDEEMPSLSPVELGEGEGLKVIATTSIVADVVNNVGGDKIDLTVLMPPSTDPHSFEPTPRDIAAVSDAHVVFANGAGLEEFFQPLLDSAGASKKAVSVSFGVELRQAGDEQEPEGEHSHQNDVDPHTWTDPNNVKVWVRNIEQALGSLDPANVHAFEAKAAEYETLLTDLDAWIEEQVDQVPEAERKIVTDHATWGYFVERYGFKMVGTVIPGYSALSEPSARELAELQDAIRDLGVRAIFVGNTVNPSLAERTAEDTGVQLVVLYTGSLSESDGPASSYLDYMRYNVSQMVNALK